MTAQIPDTVRYGTGRYDLAGIGGYGLFDPREHGLQAIAQRRAAQGSLQPTDMRDVGAWIDITFDHTYLPMW